MLVLIPYFADPSKEDPVVVKSETEAEGLWRRGLPRVYV